MAKSTRNEFEFMSMVLDALGVEYEEADIKVRERWRGKVLDGWGVDYVVDDLKQFARWRQKCLEGLAKNHGGSESWSTLYDGTVSVELNESTGNYIGTVPNIYTDASKIRVTYDGVTYVINKQDYHGNPFYGETGGEMILFNEYPFALKFDEENGMTLYTQDEGDSHAVKVEILESSSDCPMKMAHITVNVSGNGARARVYFSGVDNIGEEIVADDFINTPVHGLAYDLTNSQWVVYGTDMANGYMYGGDSTVFTALIFEGESIRIAGGAGVTAVTGDATIDNGVALVTGDCTVTLLGIAQ